MKSADYRDCLDLAGEIAERIEPSDGKSPYEGDDLIGDCIIPAIKPTIGELLWLREVNGELLAACKAIIVYADKTANCNVCACDHLEHAVDCPVETARAAIAKAEGQS